MVRRVGRRRCRRDASEPSAVQPGWAWPPTPGQAWTHARRVPGRGLGSYGQSEQASVPHPPLRAFTPGGKSQTPAATRYHATGPGRDTPATPGPTRAGLLFSGLSLTCQPNPSKPRQPAIAPLKFACGKARSRVVPSDLVSPAHLPRKLADHRRPCPLALVRHAGAVPSRPRTSCRPVADLRLER